jgi:GT2 family glycosyltransferase
MEFPKVYVIIVWYNGAKWVQCNLESLLKSDLPVTIVCIDNSSTDNTVTLLNNYSDVITLIQAPSNLGFGKANNLGIDLAIKENADYVFLLNQDTWVYPDTIDKLVTTASQYLDYGIISPMHLAPNEKDLDINFKMYFDKSTFKYEGFVKPVTFVNAAAWLIPMHVLKKVSYFEPLFDHYGEDRNFVDRIIFHNYKIGIDTKAKITHDRVVIRNYNKDLIQCKYKILATLLNPNLTEKQAKLEALKNVFGLPKYFLKFYGLIACSKLFIKLSVYYKLQLQSWTLIKQARNSY